ncbi:hypothetical protein GF407_15355 [candidate division KSB1 bacterium]|nr:hypothetical protein [candidate division KSB1 bacterium]
MGTKTAEPKRGEQKYAAENQPPEGKKPNELILLCVCALVALLVLVIWHATKANYWAADDQFWLNFVRAGLVDIWTQTSPFFHYRPLFGVWLWLVDLLGFSTPFALTLAGLLPIFISASLVFHLFKNWLSPRWALIAALLFVLHPVRHSHYLWISAQIDSWCLAFSLAAIVAGLDLAAKKQRLLLVKATGVALLSAAAFWCKEIAALVPLLILLLPTSCNWKNRLLPAAMSASGLALAALAAMMVMQGPGRGILLVESMRLFHLLYYPIQFIFPMDITTFLIYSRQSGNAFLITAAIILSVGFALLFLYMLYRFRQSWLYAAVVFMTAAGLIFIIEKSHRGLGFGVAGMALFIAGSLQTVKITFVRIAVLFILFTTWAFAWQLNQTSWLCAKQYGKRVYKVYSELRQTYGPDRHLVILGPMWSVNEIAWPVNIPLEETEHSISLWIKAITSIQPLVTEPLDDGRYRLTVTGLSRFAVPVGAQPDYGIINVDCKDKNYPVSVIFDPRCYKNIPQTPLPPLFVVMNYGQYKILK